MSSAAVAAAAGQRLPGQSASGGIVQSTATMLSTARQLNFRDPTKAIELYNSVLKIEPDDVMFSIAKAFHAYGLGNTMTFPMAVGAQAVLLPERPTPDAVVHGLGDDHGRAPPDHLADPGERPVARLFPLAR